MEPPMTSCLHRVVASLFILAAGVQAADQVTLRSERGELNATVADELQIEEQVGPNRTAKAIAVLGGRANVQAAARTLLAQGKASRADPVLYLNGRVGDPNARAVATRRVLLEAKPGSNIAALAREHGLRLIEAIKGRTGWWMAEPLSGDVYAALDASRSLAADARTAMVWPQLRMPIEVKYEPGDPLIRDNMVWHYEAAYAGHIRIQNVWDYYRGQGAVIAITDGGVQVDHQDLEANYNSVLSRDYINNDADPRPYPAASNDDNHGTAVAGLAVAVGENWTDLVGGGRSGGTAGVAFLADMAVSKILNSYNASKMSGLPTDSLVYQALTLQLGSGQAVSQVWVNNNSWGPIDDALTLGVLQPLTAQAMFEATVNGRGGFGSVLVFPAGNGGWSNPNENRPPPIFAPYPSRQDCAGFDGYLNRFTIGVGAYGTTLAKWVFSEMGSNLIISAPGEGLVTTDRSVRTNSNPNPTVDDKGYILWPYYPNPPANFDGLDDIGNGFLPYVWPEDPDHLTYENGDYHTGISGTSFACPLVSGTAALMIQARPTLSWRDVRQLMAHRSQDLRPLAGPIDFLPHDAWGQWRANGVNLMYNCWYGFGGLEASRFVFGGAGLNGPADVASIAARDEPGALRWPLLPPLLPEPLNYTATFAIPTTSVEDTNGNGFLDTPPAVSPTEDFNYVGGLLTDPYTNGNGRLDSDPYAIYDAPWNPPLPAQNLVPDGREFPGVVPPSRFTHVPMPIATAPARFRTESVEITVVLRDVGDATYPYFPYGVGGGFRWSDYAFYLTSPSGEQAILGRQRNDLNATNIYTTDNVVGEGGAWTWTFTEFFHLNEGTANGTWVLSIIDEVNSDVAAGPPGDRARDPGYGNPPRCRVESVNLNIYGHQTYDFPGLASAATGIASLEGDQTFGIGGSAFGRSAGRVPVLQAYWQPLAPTAGPPVEIPTNATTSTAGTVTVPASLLPDTSPGSGYIFVANPAVVVGRTGTTAAAVDAFDDPNALLPTTVQLPSGPVTAATRPMKRCPGTDDKIVRYSRRPTLTPIADIRVKKGDVFALTTVAFDPDVAAGLPAATPENLVVTVTSFNPGMTTAAAGAAPSANGIGTWTVNGTVTGDNGFALIEVKVTDGVLTSTRAFRVIIPTDEDGSGCGGGMGLALLGLPLAAWFIRRRRKG